MPIISMIDYAVKRLRDNSPAHAALMVVLQRPLPSTATDSDFADEILKGLWEEGFKVVARDDDKMRRA